MNALVKIGLGLIATGLLMTFVLPVLAVVAIVLLAAVADAAPAEDAIPGLERPAAIERVVTAPEPTMPAVLDLFSRVGVAGQAAVMTVGITVFEGPLNPTGAMEHLSRHVAPRLAYVFGDPLGSH